MSNKHAMNKREIRQSLERSNERVPPTQTIPMQSFSVGVRASSSVESTLSPEILAKMYSLLAK